MRNAALLLTILLLAGACSSTPSTARPEVPRPEGVEPEGLSDMRDTLSDQRAQARTDESAVSMNPAAAATSPEMGFIESIFAPVGNVMTSVRSFLFGAPAVQPGAHAQAAR